MDKAHLRRLQDKVKRLLEASSDDSDSGLPPHPHAPHDTLPPDNPETVRKCITLINENIELKNLLSKERKKNQKLTQQLSQSHQHSEEREKEYTKSLLELRKTEKIEGQDIRRLYKMEAELEEWKKKCMQTNQMLKLERRKCAHLSKFIRTEVPKLQQTITFLTAKVDSKLEPYLLQQFDI